MKPIRKHRQSPKTTPSKEIFDQQVAELTADLQRVHADFINYRRRTEEEGSRQRLLGKQLAVLELLAIADSLEKALHSVPKELLQNPWVEGIISIDKQLHVQLDKLGVSKFATLGAEFDPELMDAVSVEGAGPKEIVSDVIQEGYKMDEDVIRHAVVKVRRMK